MIARNIYSLLIYFTVTLQFEIHDSDQFAALLSSNTSITNLTLKGVRTKALMQLGNILHSNTSLVYLKLPDNEVLPVAVVKEIGRGLQSNSTLKWLNLSQCSIGDEGAKAIAHTLQYNNSLKHLYLSSNKIGKDGATAIAHTLQHNNSLKTLYLRLNKIGNDGATAIAHALIPQSILTSCDTPKSGDIANTSLTSIDICI